MLIGHSPDILFHRMARIEAGSLETMTALIAKERGAMMIEKAIDRLEAPAAVDAEAMRGIDKRA